MTLRTTSRIALLVNAVSLTALVGACLALQDIYHGEADPALEWLFLRLAFVVMLMFHVFVFALAWRGSEFPRGDRRGIDL